MRFLVKVKGRKGQSVSLYHCISLFGRDIPFIKWKNVLYDERAIQAELMKNYREQQQLIRDYDAAVKFRKQLEDMVDKIHEDKLVGSSSAFEIDVSPFSVLRKRTPPAPDKKDFEQLKAFLERGNPMTAFQRTIETVEALRKEGKAKTLTVPEAVIEPGASFSNELNLSTDVRSGHSGGGNQNKGGGGDNQQKNHNQGKGRPYVYQEPE